MSSLGINSIYNVLLKLRTSLGCLLKDVGYEVEVVPYIMF
jgi:hypothetical protein